MGASRARVLVELSDDCSVRCYYPTIHLKRTPLYIHPVVVLMLLAVMSMAVGCGKNRPVAQWNDKVLAVGRAHDAGKVDQAERDYLRLLQNPPSEDARRYILTELAEISRQRGDWDQALKRYEMVYAEGIDDEASALALYRTGLIVEEQYGDLERAIEIRRDTITRFPGSVAAEMAVADHAKYYRQTGDYEAMKRDFDQLAAKVKGTQTTGTILFAAAQNLQKAGDTDAALPYYRRIWTETPDGALADDSLWEAAQIYDARQDWPRAIELYRQGASRLISSWFMGNENSVWANDARRRIAYIYMLHLDDYPAALREIDQYLEDFPDGFMTDDVAWDRVQLMRLMHGDAAFEDAMRAFAESYPESRYMREVRRHLGEEVGP